MAYYNITDSNTIPGALAPLSPQAVILPMLAFPAWILCVPPMIWHFRQGNIAAGSAIFWIAANNIFNTINPLIWPRDNITEWWDGDIWCDIAIRIQVGTLVGLAASTALVVRKLAKVMDTRNITVSASRNSRAREKIWEAVWCWGYPLLMIILFYIVQPIRYIIFGIIGCVSAYDTSWPSIVLSFMWGPITMGVAAYYAILLVYRLYHYRREFQRLLSARNTTKSRFIRLFILCIIIVLAYTPYTIWLLITICSAIKDPYSWNEIHGNKFNTIMKLPAFGQVSVERWVQVCTGYIVFFVFGTGTDANNLYKKTLLAIGLGKLFPSLYEVSRNGDSTPNSFLAARNWSESVSSKAKKMFSSTSSSFTETVDETSATNSVVFDSVSRLHPVSTEDALIAQQRDMQTGDDSAKPKFLQRIFRRQRHQADILPLHSRNSATGRIPQSQAATSTSSPGVHAYAWASHTPTSSCVSETDGVHVVREVHQDCRDKAELDKETKSAEG